MQLSKLRFIIWLIMTGCAPALILNPKISVERTKRPRQFPFLTRNEQCRSYSCNSYSSPCVALSRNLLSKYDDDLDDITDLSKNDWTEGELTLQNFQPNPRPNLTPEAVALSCARSLQFVDYPTENDGLKRVFHYLTLECRKTVTARQGGDNVERFCNYGGLSPALQPFMGARRVDVGGVRDVTIIPGTANRGDLASVPITIYGSDVLTFQHHSGFIKGAVGQEPPVHQMVMRLEKARRPPMSDCWLVTEIIDVRHGFAGRT